MLIISTRPVAIIMKPVSAASILAGVVAACAKAGVAEMASSVATKAAMPLRADASAVMQIPPKLFEAEFLERVVIGLAGADAHGGVDVVDEDLAVADLAGLGGGANR